VPGKTQIGVVVHKVDKNETSWWQGGTQSRIVIDKVDQNVSSWCQEREIRIAVDKVDKM
jgi:hypothetical protein